MKRYLTISLLALGSGVAFAQLPAFEDVDANADGQITRDEAAIVEGLDFAALDANQDGVVSRQEWDDASGE